MGDVSNTVTPGGPILAQDQILRDMSTETIILNSQMLLTYFLTSYSDLVT